jgi:hypothetical protein
LGALLPAQGSHVCGCVRPGALGLVRPRCFCAVRCSCCCLLERLARAHCVYVTAEAARKTCPRAHPWAARGACRGWSCLHRSSAIHLFMALLICVEWCRRAQDTAPLRRASQSVSQSGFALALMALRGCTIVLLEHRMHTHLVVVHCVRCQLDSWLPCAGCVGMRRPASVAAAALRSRPHHGSCRSLLKLLDCAVRHAPCTDRAWICAELRGCCIVSSAFKVSAHARQVCVVVCVCGAGSPGEFCLQCRAC